MNNITFTQYKSTSPLSKRYWLDDTQIMKQAAAQMYTGTAERLTIPFADFAEALNKATEKQAFGYGSHPLNYPNKVKIAVSGKEKPEKNIISRTKNYYTYPPNQPAVLMIDHDPSKYGKAWTLETLLAVLIAIHPAIAKAARIVRGSVSAGVHREGEPPRTDAGFHIYFPVANAADIPRYGKLLSKLLWLAGQGHIALASNGNKLERTPIDGAVFSAERLDFVGKPIISCTGLNYTPPPINYTQGDLLDTESLLDLTDAQQSDFERLIADARADIDPASKAKKAEWATDKVEKMVTAGVSPEKAREVINLVLKGDCKDLYDDFILEFAIGSVSVADVLANPSAFDGKALADPIEGSIKGLTKAMFYWNKKDNKPFINSFAHGGCKYFLHATAKTTRHDQPIDREPSGQIKNDAVAALLANIEWVNLKEVCESLGWLMGTDGKPPKAKHFVVAIVATLIKIATKHNWNIIHNAGFFYIYNGAYWVVLVDGEVKQLLKDASIRMGYTEIECRHSGFVDVLFKQTVQDGFFIESNLNKQSIINLKNGSLILSENGVSLRPFDCQDFLTHQLDFAYDPDAINSVFLAYLEQVLPDENTRKTLQQVAGYLFVRGLKMEKIFFLFGSGSNGKSVFFEMLNGVVGQDNISNYSLESLTDDKGYHRAMIKDKIVNYGTDIRLTKIDAGMFKTLASGEPIEARLPYRDPFMMTDYAKLIFNVNKMDSANIEHTHGFYRRLLIIPFNVTIPEDQQDRDLHKKILEDRAGVLNWIIEGAEQVIRNRNIFISDECEKFKKQFLKESDSVAMFEEDFRETMPGSIYFETVNTAHANYKNFCFDADHKPLGRNNFSKRMEVLGFEKRKAENGTVLEKHYF